MAKAKNSLTINNQVEYYQKAAEEGSIPDEQNPVFIVQTFPNELLLKIALEQLDIRPFATHELKSRGLNKKGEWVGFSKAEAIWEKTKQTKTRNKKPFRGL